MYGHRVDINVLFIKPKGTVYWTKVSSLDTQLEIENKIKYLFTKQGSKSMIDTRRNLV